MPTAKNKKETFFAHYMYKCRMCGRTYMAQGSGFSIEHTSTEMFKAVHYSDSPRTSPMITYHLCKNGNFGITDFVGVRKHKEPFIVKENKK